MLNVLHALLPYPTTFWREYYHSDVAEDEIKVLERLGISSKPTQPGVQVLIQGVWHRSLRLKQVSEFCGPRPWQFFGFWVTTPFRPLWVLVFSVLGSPGMGCPFPSLHDTHPDNNPLSPGLAWGSFCFLPPCIVHQQSGLVRARPEGTCLWPHQVVLSTSPGSSPREEKGP